MAQRIQILVVDDDASIRKSLMQVLRADDFEVFGAATTDEAFTQFQFVPSPTFRRCPPGGPIHVIPDKRLRQFAGSFMRANELHTSDGTRQNGQIAVIESPTLICELDCFLFLFGYFRSETGQPQ